MKRLSLLTFVLIISLPLAASAGKAPVEVGGFVLGEHIKSAEKRVFMDTQLPTRFMNSLKEVEIKPVPGFKTGLISYATCAESDEIVRIKLKYSDSSKRFFDQLVKVCKKRFGEPDKWRGDAFGLIFAWKWSFTNEDGHQISMVVQHNVLDDTEKTGNSIKLTDFTAMMAEKACFEKNDPGPAVPPWPKKPDWNFLAPK